MNEAKTDFNLLDKEKFRRPKVLFCSNIEVLEMVLTSRASNILCFFPPQDFGLESLT